ncbi:MAG: hypothetical protein AAF752_03545 [Bacteroidota bacterium]
MAHASNTGIPEGWQPVRSPVSVWITSRRLWAVSALALLVWAMI